MDREDRVANPHTYTQALQSDEDQKFFKIVAEDGVQVRSEVEEDSRPINSLAYGHIVLAAGPVTSRNDYETLPILWEVPNFPPPLQLVLAVLTALVIWVGAVAVSSAVGMSDFASWVFAGVAAAFGGITILAMIAYLCKGSRSHTGFVTVRDHTVVSAVETTLPDASAFEVLLDEIRENNAWSDPVRAAARAAGFDMQKYLAWRQTRDVFSGGGVANVLMLAACVGVCISGYAFPIPGQADATCGLEGKTGSNSLQLHIRDDWIFQNLSRGNVTFAKANSLLYSPECYRISRLDIVEAQDRSPCQRWCEAHIGSFAYNMYCGLFYDVHVLVVCSKADIGDWFSFISLQHMAIIGMTYASCSLILGVRRRNRLRKLDPDRASRLRFERKNEDDTLLFLIPMTRESKQRTMLVKILVSIVFDILTDLLNVLVLLVHGEPFFSFCLFYVMCNSFGTDDLFQSVAITEWLFSWESGFPTIGLLRKIKSEGSEGLYSFLITVYVITCAPVDGLSLSSTCGFLISSIFSVLCLHGSQTARHALYVMQKHPSTASAFDERIGKMQDIEIHGAFEVAGRLHDFVAGIAYAYVTRKPLRAVVFYVVVFFSCMAFTIAAAFVRTWVQAGCKDPRNAMQEFCQKWRTDKEFPGMLENIGGSLTGLVLWYAALTYPGASLPLQPLVAISERSYHSIVLSWAKAVYLWCFGIFATFACGLWSLHRFFSKF